MVNLNPRSPGQIQQMQAEGQISPDVPSSAVYTGQAWEALGSAAGALSEQLSKLADQAAVREKALAGLDVGRRASEAFLQSQAVGNEAAGVAGKGPWLEQAKARLRHEEGFRDNPYWDTNAYRVGYGSDTTIGADGRVVKVTKGMKITRDQAEKDLEYRLLHREGAQVRKQLGALWDNIPDNAKAALVSVGYNYGSLPKQVVAAAKTGDLKAIASAVSSLPVNGARRKREAAMILGAGSPMNTPAAPTKLSSSTSPEPQPPTLPSVPLALRRDGTLSGEAYDNAAISAYSWRMQQGIANDLNAAHEQYQDDPQAFATALADIRGKYAADPNLQDPQMREVFDKSFSDQSEAYVRNVQDRQIQRTREEQQASFAEGLTAQQISLERQAQILGSNQQGDHIIARQIAQMGTAIDTAMQSGTISPAKAIELKAKVAETAATGRIQGVFDALPTPESKEQFALSVLDEWKSNKGPLSALPYETVKSISETLRRDARDAVNAKAAIHKTEIATLDRLAADDIASLQTTGKGLDPSSGLTAARVLELTGQEGLDKWQAARAKAGMIWDASNGMEKQSAADILLRVKALEPKPGQPGFSDAADAYNAARQKAQEILKEREVDPIGQAARAGVVPVQALDPSSPERLVETLQSRREAQAKVAGLFGQAVPYFRPGEKEMLAGKLATNPEALSSFAFTVRQVYGDDTAKVLAELAPDAPIIAHTAGLAFATGDNSVANDVANTLALKREKMLSAKMPSAGEMGLTASRLVSGAFVGNPKAQGPIVQTANILFEQMANTYGFDATEIDKPDTPAAAAYAKALDRAAGGRTIGTVAYGGMGEVNGSPIVVPTDMPKERPQELLDSIDEDLLARLPPVRSGDFALTSDQLRSAALVTVGDGLYRVALGDPQSENPRYLLQPNGKYWVLDLRTLEDIQPGAPLKYKRIGR